MDRERKKIGIVTFHRANNYGAVLQAFSLCHKINEFSYANVIDYHSKEMDKDYYLTFSLKSIIKFVLSFFKSPNAFFASFVRNKRFKKFRKKYIVLSKKYTKHNLLKANNLYDKFVVGSDQVWNPICNKHDDAYFLTFAVKKYSYAASFGVKMFAKDIYDELITKLGGFNNYSVREKDGLAILNKLGINNNISCDCDPVFLTNKEKWISYFNLKKENKNKYILVYIMAKDNNSLDFARLLSKKSGLPLYYLSPFNFSKNPRDFKAIRKAGPIEFLELIYNASYVITTSFHGLAFSLIFNIPFFYELSCEANNKNSRIENLEEIFSICNHRIDSNEPSSVYNWNYINSVIKKKQKESSDRLVRIINE